MSPQAPNPRDAANFLDLAVDHLRLVLSHPSTTDGNATAGDLEAQPEGTNDRSNGEGHPISVNPSSTVENQISAGWATVVVNLFSLGWWSCPQAG